MGYVAPEHQELFALELEKLLNMTVYTSIYKYKPISTKLGQNVCDHKISDEFDCGFNRTKNCHELFALEFAKIAESDLVYTLASTKCRPISTNHGHNL